MTATTKPSNTYRSRGSKTVELQEGQNSMVQGRSAAGTTQRLLAGPAHSSVGKWYVVIGGSQYNRFQNGQIGYFVGFRKEDIPIPMKVGMTGAHEGSPLFRLTLTC